VFAHVEGTTILGEVSDAGDEPMPGATVTALDPSDNVLGEATTDDDGRFRIEARHRCDHKLMVDAGAGHVVSYTVEAKELPDTLAHSHGSTAHEAAHAGPLHEELKALSRQVVELRGEVSEYRQSLRYQDLVGAIGYIVGLMGLAFYFLGVKKRDAVKGEGH